MCRVIGTIQIIGHIFVVVVESSLSLPVLNITFMKMIGNMYYLFNAMHDAVIRKITVFINYTYTLYLNE